jgi:uncharacterized cupredoxin-like copper-binding protein
MSPLRFACAAALAGATLALPTHDAAAQPAKTVTVTVILNSHYFQPNPIHLAGGVPVHLILENKSGKTHDFTAPEFFQAAQIIAGGAPAGTITLAKGRGTAIDLIPRRGTYKLHCSQPFHTMLGMTGKIVVS